MKPDLCGSSLSDHSACNDLLVSLTFPLQFAQSPDRMIWPSQVAASATGDWADPEELALLMHSLCTALAVQCQGHVSLYFALFLTVYDYSNNLGCKLNYKQHIQAIFLPNFALIAA